MISSRLRDVFYFSIQKLFLFGIFSKHDMLLMAFEAKVCSIHLFLV